MHSTVKYIVSALGEAPYNKKFNIVSFDSLGSEDLLQLLSDVLAELDPSHKVDVRIEVPEQTIVRILSFLRVLKYRPDSNISPQAFRQGLLNGDKHVIHPILEWLLKNSQDLQKRAYLGKYLVKLDIPGEILTDVDIYNMHEQYEGLVEQFKTVHKEYEAIENSGVNVNELRADLTAMENERDIVNRRLEQMSRKIDSVPGKDQILRAVTRLRQERDRKKEILTQLSDETEALHRAQQRHGRLVQQLAEIKKAMVGATPESLMSRLEEEVQVTRYIVKEKLSRELVQLRRQHEIYTTVSSDNYLSKATVESLASEIHSVRAQVNALVEKQKHAQGSSQDKLAPFRQQAAIIARKKDSIVDEYRQAMSRYNNLLSEIEEKQLELARAGGGEVPRGEEFKQYIARLKQSNLAYKANRAGLAALRTETGVLQRTADVLQARSHQLGVPEDIDSLQSLPSLSSGQVISPDTEDKEQLIGFVAQVSNSIAAHKTRLVPLLEELRPLREQAASVAAEHEEVKRNYDRTSTILETGAEKLSQDVTSLREDKRSTELDIALVLSKAQVARVEIDRSSGPAGQAMREAVLASIQEREKWGRTLKETHRQMKSTLEQSVRQKMLWTNLQRLFEVKHRTLEAVREKEGTLHLDCEHRVQTLVLN